MSSPSVLKETFVGWGKKNNVTCRPMLSFSKRKGGKGIPHQGNIVQIGGERRGEAIS